jgi:hypothetical protein
VQPLDLAPGVLEVELSSRSVGLQTQMLVGVEQAFEVEARCPLVLGLKNRLGVIQAYSQDVLGQLAVGACQFLRGGAQPTVRYIDLFDERVVDQRRLLSLIPIRTSRAAIYAPVRQHHCPT